MKSKRKPLKPLPTLNGVPSIDVLSGSKELHLRITKEQFIRCKMQIFQHGISMSRLACWLLKEVAEENPHALKLVDGLVKHELHKQMNALRNDVESAPKQWYDDLDTATVYSLIEDATNAKEIISDIENDVDH